jgi:putative peptide modification system cyclase
MNAQLAPSSEHPQHAQALLRTLVITDLCDSTALVERLGDQRTAELIREHDRLLRGLIRRHRGQEVDKTDGFLSLFERPIQAVAFALDYQRDLQAFAREHGVALKARIGIHVGEVMTWQNNSDDVADGAKPMEVEGLAKPIAARLMGLALPGQILLSSVAYTLAHRAEGELGATLSRLKWKHHGRFRFKGVAEAVPVYEIGEPEIAPFRSPAWTGKAHREVPLWRRPLSLALEGLLLLALVALPLWHFLKPEPAIAFAERDWVVLGDLRNLTGDARFDDSLEQAFRIGLEQSRYVNVLSDLQVRDALQRMQRDPGLSVDRPIGAEIAMREGSRALVLPTLAEVGGRLRFTAEVIDPTTQATVYSEYADGRGVESVLPLVDEVNRKLRERLGEAVAQVNDSSKPLEKVATADLDALRAYSRAIELNQARETDDAIALLRRAIQIDPGFVRARIELALILDANGARNEAIVEIDATLAQRDRMSDRDKRYTDALRQSLSGPSTAALDSWRQLDLQYPDFFPASGGHAWLAWRILNDYPTALDAASRNASEQNPRRSVGLYLLGVLLTGSGSLDRAEAAFLEAEKAGQKYENVYWAASHAASRRFDAAEGSLSAGTAIDSDSKRALRILLRAAILADRGNLGGSIDFLEDGLSQMEAPTGRPAEALKIAAYALAAFTAPGKRDVPELNEAALPAIEKFDYSGAQMQDLNSALLISWIAFRNGSHDTGERALHFSNQLDLGHFPEIQQRRAILRSELLASEAQWDLSVGALDPYANGKELVLSRAILSEQQIKAGRYDEAQSNLDWLAANRGRSYVEPLADHALMPLNVFLSSQALLQKAELSLIKGDLTAAKALLTEYLRHSPLAEDDQYFAPRVMQLSTQIESRRHQ